MVTFAHLTAIFSRLLVIHLTRPPIFQAIIPQVLERVSISAPAHIQGAVMESTMLLQAGRQTLHTIACLSHFLLNQICLATPYLAP
jgi:hypothetical protein